MALSDYEDALKSYILDDDKLVTYKWLSKEFEVHVNIAKDLLKQYWEKNKDEEDITATFLLVGQLKDGSIRIEVVKEENLSAVREKFVKIDCEHLYSLQKSLEEIELLALTEDGDLRFSAIKCNEEYLRSNTEINSLRYIGNTRKEENKSANKVPEKQVPKQVDFSSKDKTNNLINNKAEKDEAPKAERKSIESKTEAERSQSIEKKVSPKNNAKDTSKINNKVSKKPVQSKKSGFNNLFGKVQSKPQPLENLKEDSDDSKSENKEALQLSNKKDDTKNEQEKEKSQGTESSEKENEIQQSEVKSKENKIQQFEVKSKAMIKTKIEETKSRSKKDARGKKRNRSQEKDTASKRKRIVVMDSSEDESDKSIDDEEEEPMEVVEEPVNVTRKRSPSPPVEKRENGKRMVSKYIDKTYKDEDGFLVTKRVQVYEAVSDNEEPEVVKTEELKKAKPADTKAKKKQTTLTNFFKKS
ncbi:DNA polymerase delta subunit 3 isoform X2 [Nasonia vitripennis]|uniref:DNA polymerase delta subunit 3 n=1 Tax=Nasonia vitripennis TaxID=7425 RepID=A0A7M7G128_NASVI|nr:DNA polymerase delta subunit 3 isoform X2 [Nasonia vitripennis]